MSLPWALSFFRNRERRAAGPQWRVLERDRRPEDCHDAVAGERLYHAALLAHGVVHQILQSGHKRKGCFLTRRFGERGEAHHVGKMNGNLPSFRFHACAPRGSLVFQAGQKGKKSPFLIFD
jgi:hypothetical protein